MFKKVFLQTSLTSPIFSVTTLIIVPTTSETICGTYNILLKTGLMCQKIHQAFAITVKAMCNFPRRMSYCTGKCFRFRYIETYMTDGGIAGEHLFFC